MCDDRSTTRTTFGLLLAAIKVAHFDREVQLLAALQSNKCNTGSIEGTGSSGREEAPASPVWTKVKALFIPSALLRS